MSAVFQLNSKKLKASGGPWSWWRAERVPAWIRSTSARVPMDMVTRSLFPSTNAWITAFTSGRRSTEIARTKGTGRPAGSTAHVSCRRSSTVPVAASNDRSWNGPTPTMSEGALEVDHIACTAAAPPLAYAGPKMCAGAIRNWANVIAIGEAAGSVIRTVRSSTFSQMTGCPLRKKADRPGERRAGSA